MKKFNPLEFSYEVTIPSVMVFDPKLDSSAIRLYAVIKGLAKATGYCYATNEYLSNCLDVPESTMRRWLKSLKDCGYVDIETSKNGILFQRNIYVSVDLKKVLRKLKNEHPPAHIRAPYIKSIKYKEKEEKKVPKKNETPAEASALPHLFLSELKKRKPDANKVVDAKWVKTCNELLSIRTEKQLQNIIKHSLDDPFWSGVVVTPMKLLKNLDEIEVQMKKPSKNINIEKENKKLIQEIYTRFPSKNMSGEINCSENYIEFTRIPEGHIKIIDKAFREKVINNLRKMKLDVEGL